MIEKNLEYEGVVEFHFFNRPIFLISRKVIGNISVIKPLTDYAFVKLYSSRFFVQLPFLGVLSPSDVFGRKQSRVDSKPRTTILN